MARSEARLLIQRMVRSQTLSVPTHGPSDRKWSRSYLANQEPVIWTNAMDRGLVMHRRTNQPSGTSCHCIGCQDTESSAYAIIPAAAHNRLCFRHCLFLRAASTVADGDQVFQATPPVRHQVSSRSRDVASTKPRVGPRGGLDSPVCAMCFLLLQVWSGQDGLTNQHTFARTSPARFLANRICQVDRVN